MAVDVARRLLSARGMLSAPPLSAIDIALWDIKGKALECRSWLLGGLARDRASCYPTTSGIHAESNP